MNLLPPRSPIGRLDASRSVVAVFAGAERVDVGLPYCRPSRSKEVKERRQVMRENKRNVELERASRLRTCTYAFARCQRKCGVLIKEVNTPALVAPNSEDLLGASAANLGGDQRTVPHKEAGRPLWGLQGPFSNGVFSTADPPPHQLWPGHRQPSALWESADTY